MAASIRLADVQDGFTTQASEADIVGFIAVVDQADACLDANNVPDAIQRQLKVLGVRHLVQNAADRGAVLEERAVSGASRKYAERAAGETSYLQTLRTIDQYGCVLNVISRNGFIQLRSVGRASLT